MPGGMSISYTGAMLRDADGCGALSCWGMSGCVTDALSSGLARDDELRYRPLVSVLPTCSRGGARASFLRKMAPQGVAGACRRGNPALRIEGDVASRLPSGLRQCWPRPMLFLHLMSLTPGLQQGLWSWLRFRLSVQGKRTWIPLSGEPWFVRRTGRVSWRRGRRCRCIGWWCIRRFLRCRLRGRGRIA